MDDLTIDKTELMTFDTIPATPQSESQVKLARHLVSHPEDYRCVFLHLPADQRFHLTHAIRNQWGKDNRSFAVINVTGFTDELIAAIRHGENCSYASYYVDPDILIVDDLQFFAGKETTQEAFYAYVLKPRIEGGRLTVLLSEYSHEGLAGLLRDDFHNLIRLGLHGVT
jgi:chromosomal replication initiation ATPase DnaA